jgi:hypothetical protein
MMALLAGSLSIGLVVLGGNHEHDITAINKAATSQKGITTVPPNEGVYIKGKTVFCCPLFPSKRIEVLDKANDIWPNTGHLNVCTVPFRIVQEVLTWATPHLSWIIPYWRGNNISITKGEWKERNIGCVANAVSGRLTEVFDLSSDPYANDRASERSRHIYQWGVVVHVQVRPKLMLAGRSDLLELPLASVPKFVSRLSQGESEPGNSDCSQGGDGVASVAKETKSTFSIKANSYDSLADNIDIFVKGCIGFAVLILMKAGLKEVEPDMTHATNIRKTVKIEADANACRLVSIP